MVNPSKKSKKAVDLALAIGNAININRKQILQNDVRLLSGCCLVDVWLLSGCCPVVVWLMSVCCLVVVLLMSG